MEDPSADEHRDERNGMNPERTTLLTPFEWLCAGASVCAAVIGVVGGNNKFLLIPVICIIWPLSRRSTFKVVPAEDVRKMLQRGRYFRLSEERIERAIKTLNAGPKAARLISYCGFALTAFGGLIAAIMELRS